MPVHAHLTDNGVDSRCPTGSWQTVNPARMAYRSVLMIAAAMAYLMALPSDAKPETQQSTALVIGAGVAGLKVRVGAHPLP